MKKALTIAIAAIMLVLLVGCGGKEIIGSCDEVVGKCQGVTDSDNATVIVSGYITGSSDILHESAIMTDDGSFSGKKVFVYIASGDHGKPISGKTTFKGKLVPSQTEKDQIAIDNATVVK